MAAGVSERATWLHTLLPSVTKRQTGDVLNYIQKNLFFFPGLRFLQCSGTYPESHMLWQNSPSQMAGWFLLWLLLIWGPAPVNFVLFCNRFHWNCLKTQQRFAVTTWEQRGRLQLLELPFPLQQSCCWLLVFDVPCHLCLLSNHRSVRCQQTSARFLGQLELELEPGWEGLGSAGCVCVMMMASLCPKQTVLVPLMQCWRRALMLQAELCC